MSDTSSRIAQLSPKQRAVLELRRAQSAKAGKNVAEPIAVVGIGCRFPGGVTGPAFFWELLRNGVDAITEVPRERWDVDAYYDPNPDAPGKMYTRWGGFLSNVDRFDAKFFNIAPREAMSMDPQQRLLLEVAWEALEHAGQPPDKLVGTKTGIFVGMMTNDYSQLNLVGHDVAQMDVYSGSGVDYSFAAGRLSYVLGVQGPSMVVATACSSALVATHLACQSLRAGECQLALAGGVNLILTPEATIYSCRIRSMAADGRCKTFDAAADGYVRGEGCGIVVLKRLADAVRDGDAILALVRGSAINHDGKSAGLTVPNAAAQQAVLRSALANGGVNPAQVGYVEAHGTGTPLGDPIEVRSLWAVLGQGRQHPLVVSSAKTNLGHLEAAAGAVGLIKTVLALQHREIPPHLHLEKRSPYIEWDSMQIEIPRELMSWPAENVPAIAGVSSFGLSGMNGHVVLEEAPQAAPALIGEARTYVLPLSARTPGALRALMDSYRDVLGQNLSAVRDMCYTASVRRSHHEERIAVVGATAEELLEGLKAAPRPARHSKLAFVFPGQGGQYSGMASQLLREEPVFRNTVEACDRAFRAYVDWPLTEMLDQIERVQPALFAVQVGLAALWQSWGIQPDAVIGHSMGEVAAAHVAGILSLEHAAQIICRRSALLRQIRGRGGMLLVELSLAEAVARTGLAIAASNGPRSTVIAGDVAALDRLQAELESESVFCRRVQVDVASHSEQVDELAPELEKALAGVEGQAGTIPLYSTVTGRVCAGEDCGPQYWMRNLRQRVQFWEGLQKLAADGYGEFVEISPHPVLGPGIADGLRALSVEGEVRASLRRGEDDRRVMQETLAALYEQGRAVAWQALYPEGGRHVDLPTYPWQRERFWLAEPPRERRVGRAGTHPLLGERHEFSGQPGTHVWELELSTKERPELADHRVEGLIVVPAAVYVELALAAGAALFGEGQPALEQLRFQRMLVLPEEGHVEVQVVVNRTSGDAAHVRISSRSAETWIVHTTGRITLSKTAATAVSIAEIQGRCREFISGQEYYAALSQRGLDYGPAFQGVSELWRQDGEAIARLQVRSQPALLDACFQVLGAALPLSSEGDSAPALPVGLQRLRILKPLEGELWAHARQTGDVLLLDAAGEVVVEIEGFQIQQLQAGSREKARFADWLYEIQWQAQELPPPEKAAEPGLWLVLADRRGIGDALAESLRARGERCTVIRAGSLDASDAAAFRQVFADSGVCRGVIHLWGLDVAAPLSTAQAPLCMGVVNLVQALSTAGWRDAPRLWLITSGALEQASLWGLGRTIAIEHPELACTRMEISTADGVEALCAEILAAGREDQIALRNGTRYVTRLARWAPHTRASEAPRTPAGDRPFRLEIDTPGILDNLTLRASQRRTPGPEEVEIEVRAAGLNFLDVLAAMGVRPDTVEGPIALGGECAGVVVAVGAGVSAIKVGDPVVALGPFCFGTHVTTNANLVAPKPPNLSFAEAAAIPVVFLTAYYALLYLGRLGAGDRVLIHSASGGTGLAAVQLAQRAGAEVFATAGTPEKRAFLESLGIHHVMDSRSLDFAGKVMAWTDGRGVDVVLNSLTGEAIASSLAVLAPYGRFLEIGKKDIYQNSQLGLEPFQKNLSYFAVDLARMAVERPAFVHKMLIEILGQFADGSLRPASVQSLPVQDALTAFHTIAQAKHTGKLVLTFEDARNAPIAPASIAPAPIRADGTYLIAGGLGGLGLVVAGWLVEQGARHLLLVGRRRPEAAAEIKLEEWRAAGVTVMAAQADIAQREQLAGALAQPGLPPLRGVIHAAAVLEDSTLLRLGAARMEAVMRPKIDGAWNLHELTQHAPLDFFVLFSSAASVLGSPGQANYSAANAFLDALANYRRERRLPALSINWGPWGEVGLAAAQANRGERLATQGMASIAPRQGLAALAYLLTQDVAQVAAMPFNLRHWRQLFPRATRAPFLAQLLSEGESTATQDKTANAMRAALEAVPAAMRQPMLEAHLSEQIAHVLRVAAGDVGRDTPLPTLGLDSLMALELRNRLELSLGVTLSATLIWGYPSVGALAPFLIEKMGLAADGAAATEAREDAALASRPASRMEELPEDRAEALLSEKLAALDLEYQ